VPAQASVPAASSVGVHTRHIRLRTPTEQPTQRRDARMATGAPAGLTSGCVNSVADRGRCTRKLAVWHCEMLSKATIRTYESGNALVQAFTSVSTWPGSVQPNIGSFHMLQYLLS
jgi:hypothetical protein